MSKRRVESVRLDLIEKRRALLGRSQEARSEGQRLLEEHEADWEERAANLSAARLLNRLGYSELLQLRRVQAALDRIEDGSYGRCLRCKQPIGRARLEVMPETDWCAACAEAN
jgi:RNA polymerase-binding transcription factor DksA